MSCRRCSGFTSAQFPAPDQFCLHYVEKRRYHALIRPADTNHNFFRSDYHVNLRKWFLADCAGVPSVCIRF
jgi:hypothetical protein